ncbi:hypothetical protein JR316_0004033 [Psilocybe cubensis]|uniref:Uncharacterized protein n=1 Tax=Psilocybe cubensis TaxID=181762 RepID=A0ACB8H9F1_PSICU|nr:hypothetical protein JR316_0004033 [Psilocybe cubensis]KAH9484551.1 hypothetical protein JR316_0004033 [Psilocybe cubensis]
MTEKVEKDNIGEVERPGPAEEAPSEVTLSDRSSVEHPYRSFLEGASFARCHTTAFTSCGTETYARSLLMAGNGFPIWDPVGDTGRPSAHLKSGLMIGDVGYLSDEGDFQYHFNIFLPPSSEVHFNAPANLEPLFPALQSKEIKTETNYFAPGTVIASTGVEVTRVQDALNAIIKGRECGILVLPNGAYREDVISTTRIRDYAQKHALDWYRFLNGTRGHVICPNGSLCLVTGYDKATSWATCTSNPQGLAESGSVITVTYENGEFLRNPDAYRKCSQSGDGSETCAVFVRAIRLAVSLRDWTKKILSYQPPTRILYYNMLSGPVVGLRARIHTLRLKQFLPKRKSVNATLCIFHPLDVLLHVLLRESQIADVATLDDSVWCHLTDKSNTDPLVQTWNLWIKVLETHEIHNADGLVTLVPAENDHSQAKPSFSPSSLLFNLPSRIQREYNRIRRRREIVRKISAVFPGPPLPKDVLIVS